MSYFSCPECNKTISGVMDTGKTLFPVFGAFGKKKCQFCGTSLRLNGLGLAIGFLLYLVVGYWFMVGVESTGIYAPQNLKQAISVLLYATLIPFSILIFCMLLPLILGVVGAKLYDKN